MRNPGEIRIEKAIAHVVDHHHFEEPVVSDFALAVDKRPRLREYFEAQIDAVLADPEAVAARFLNPGKNPAAGDCRRILTQPRSFKSASQDLARLLYEAIGGNRSIAAGNFLVSTYSAENYEGVTFLALLKIDLTEVLIQEIETDAQGRHTVTYSIHDNALPTLGRKLQKAVVVRLRGNPKPDFEILLLDKQVPQAAAEFFAKTFLEAEPVYTTQERTREFVRAAYEAFTKVTRQVKEKPPLADLAAANQMLHHIRAATRAKQVNTAVFVDSMPGPDEAKQVFRAELAKRLTEQDFAIDPKFAATEVLPKKRFVGGYGIEVEYLAKFEGVVFKEIRQEKQQDGTVITTVQLRVPNLRWVK